MEIIEFIENKKLYRQIRWFFGNRFIARVKSRLVAVKFFFQRKLSFHDLYRNIMPDKWFDDIDYKKVFHVIEDDLLNKIDFTLFGEKFWYQTEHKVNVISELLFILHNDQYHAKDFLKSSSVVIDAGANFGVFSCLAATIARKGRIYSFEPVGITYDFLLKNTNKYPNVVPYQMGLGDEDSMQKIHFNPGKLHLSILDYSGYYDDNYKEYGKTEEVEIIKIDSFIAKNNITKFDFLKIDTEGYEKEILLGAKKSIKKFKPIIAVSAYHQFGDKEKIVEIIQSIDPNYRYELSSRGEEDLIFYH